MNPRICISNKFTVNGNAADPGNTLTSALAKYPSKFTFLQAYSWWPFLSVLIFQGCELSISGIAPFKSPKKSMKLCPKNLHYTMIFLIITFIFGLNQIVHETTSIQDGTCNIWVPDVSNITGLLKFLLCFYKCFIDQPLPF